MIRTRVIRYLTVFNHDDDTWRLTWEELSHNSPYNSCYIIQLRTAIKPESYMKTHTYYSLLHRPHYTLIDNLVNYGSIYPSFSLLTDEKRTVKLEAITPTEIVLDVSWNASYSSTASYTSSLKGSKVSVKETINIPTIFYTLYKTLQVAE